MRGVNRVILVGNATRNAELHHTETGKQVANIRLATNRIVKTAAGEAEERTQYHTVVCFDRLAEQTATYVKKGRALYVDGRLEYREYTDTEGAKRQVTEIVASDVTFLDNPGRDKALPEPEATERAEEVSAA